MKRRKLKMMMLVCSLSAVFLVGGSLAYFTDTGNVTNTFTVGKVSLDLLEPDWPGNDSDLVKEITPNQEVAKNPEIENTGTNDEYCFIELDIPWKDIVTANANGTTNASAKTELFSTVTQSGKYGLENGWTEVGYLDAGGELIEVDADNAKFLESGVVRHLYAYGRNSGLKKLGAGETTVPVFSYIRMVNAIEGQGIEGTAQDLDVYAYVIQADNINEKASGGDNADGETTAVEVWNVLRNQTSSTIR